MNGSELHAVLGASGGIGSAVVRELVRRGYRVRAVNRRGDADVPEGVERRAGDASTPEGARAAVAGASVVYHAAQPPYTRWPREFPPMTDNVIAGAATAGAKVVFADNLYMYGPAGPQPMTEGAPRNAAGKKGKTRILMEGRLLEAHRSGSVRTTMGRSSDYYGPRGTDTVAGDRVFGAAVEGKTARWLGSLDRPHTLNYLPDLARALVTLGEREEADGEAWHLPAAEPITGRRFLGMVFAEAGGPARIGVVSKTAVRLGGVFVPFVREVRETMYQFERPFVSEASKFLGTFGPFEPTPHGEAVARTVAWFRERRGR